MFNNSLAQTPLYYPLTKGYNELLIVKNSGMFKPNTSINPWKSLTCQLYD